jgi:hypothetical protein
MLISTSRLQGVVALPNAMNEWAMFTKFQNTSTMYLVSPSGPLCHWPKWDPIQGFKICNFLENLFKVVRG